MMNRNRLAIWTCIAAAMAAPGVAFAQFPQGFDSGGAGVAPLPAGWVSVNASPGGPGTNPNWQQRGDGAVFPQQSGTGYAFANYNSSTGANTISNYMMSPEVTLENGTIIRFWTRTATGSPFPDRMILTYSTNGASTTPTDFANLANVNFHVLVSVNPNLTVGGYPDTWTQFISPPISGLAGPTQGRIAFWYYVTNAGPNGVNSNYIGVDHVELVPPGATTGACCDGAGNCTLTTPAACTAPGNTYFGIASDCGAVSCLGKCCQPDGFCANLAPNACTGAGSIFSGVGTACDPLNFEECLGRCCMPDGSCVADGPGPCVANGGTFGGIGNSCDGNVCRGRCCLANGTCIANSSPNSCAIAGGTLTLAADCSVYTNVTFSSGGVPALPVPIPVQEAPVEVSNVQTVSGITGTIGDLNVGVTINHDWIGDIEVRLEHELVTVLLIQQMAPNHASGFGCPTEDIDVVLDDEGEGGSIHNQCNAAAPAALSPPNYVPAQNLSDFDGLNPNGAWTLKVTDTYPAADGGSLIGWSLQIGVQAAPSVICAPPCACKGDMNGSGTVNGADINRFAQCVASGGGSGCACADINGGGINASDVTPFVNALIAGTACIP